MSLKAKDLMSPMTDVVQEDILIHDLTKLLREKRISGLPVCDKHGKICGMVTVTDIFMAMNIVRRMNLHKIEWLTRFMAGKNAIKVKEIYNRKIYSVTPESPIEEIVSIMLDKKIHTVLVMDKEQTTVYGVVGRYDVTWAVFGLTHAASQP